VCFSASASFVAGAGLVVIGAMTIKRAERNAELPFSAIPLLFGAQQTLEGIIWLTFRFDTPLLNTVMTNAYSLFSHVLWPIYVPFAVLLLEPVPWRRKTLYTLLAIGTAAGLYLLVIMARFPITSQPIGAHIEYVSPHFYVVVVMGSYLAGTCLSMLFSSHKVVNVFGAIALLLFVAAYQIYTLWLIYVWCFFAAVLSVVVYLHFRTRECRLVLA
jgi:hypothetical protein